MDEGHLFPLFHSFQDPLTGVKLGIYFIQSSIVVSVLCSEFTHPPFSMPWHVPIQSLEKQS